MAITQGFANSFKRELLTGTHDFATDTFKIALYTSAANIGPNSTGYTATGEVSGPGYTAGGLTLTKTATYPKIEANKGAMRFEQASWPGASFTVRGAMIYNASQGNKAVVAIDFGGDQVVVASTFNVLFDPGANPAISIT